MDGGTILGLMMMAFVLALFWAPTRLLIFWAGGLAAVIGLAVAVGPVWFIAILLALMLLK